MDTYVYPIVEVFRGLFPSHLPPGIVTSTRYEGGFLFSDKDHGRLTRQRELCATWADKRFADPILTRAQPSTCPKVDCSQT